MQHVRESCHVVEEQKIIKRKVKTDTLKQKPRKLKSSEDSRGKEVYIKESRRRRHSKKLR